MKIPGCVLMQSNVRIHFYTIHLEHLSTREMLVKVTVEVSRGCKWATKHALAHMLPAQCPGGVWVSANPVCSLQWQHTSLFIPWSVTLSVSASQERAAQPQVPQRSLWSIPKHWKSITLHTLDEVRGLHRAQRIPKNNTHLAAMPPEYGAASFSRLWDIWTHQHSTVIFKKSFL